MNKYRRTRSNPTESGHVIGGYPAGEGGTWTELLGWDGKPTGIQVRATSSWSTPHSFTGSRMYSYEGKDSEGNLYHGRGFGKGMSLSLRRKRSR